MRSRASTTRASSCLRFARGRGPHDAAAEMFGRGDVEAERFTDYAGAVAAALRGGGESISAARTPLLAKADELDAGPFNVTDQWVVLIDPVMMSEEELATLQALAREAQATINTMLIAVGESDNATADAIMAAGNKFGYVEERGPAADLTGCGLMATSGPMILSKKKCTSAALLQDSRCWESSMTDGGSWRCGGASV